DGYSDNDEVHFSESAYLKLGSAMAYAMLGLEPVGYAEWASFHTITGGPNQDDDGDGYSNRSEYALDGNPANTPEFSLSIVDGFPAYSVPRNLAASDTFLAIDFSFDLFDWTSQPPDRVSSMMQSNGTS
ncbi:hypothetical protein P4B35_24165, partial [Pontiellaceae bacterium B12227]|nr:hypothetical protein [Pontiellaceae bacterium B12227]